VHACQYLSSSDFGVLIISVCPMIMQQYDAFFKKIIVAAY